MGATMYSKYRVVKRFFCSSLGLYFPIGAEVWYWTTHAAKIFGVPYPANPSGSVAFSNLDKGPGEIDGWFREPVLGSYFVFLGNFPDEVAGQAVLTVKLIDEDAGIVTLVNPTVQQIEVWKYTRLSLNDSHIGPPPLYKVYPPHLGKRYKRFMQLPMGATTWTVPDWSYRNKRRNYFKFALRISDTESSPLTQETIVTAMAAEVVSTHTKIYLMATG
jgi:hypothetical protein